MQRAVLQRSNGTQIPAPAYFLVSALFHYLGPSLAVLLFAQISVLGVAWLRIASAAAVFLAALPGSWKRIADDGALRGYVLALGIVLAAMNSCFYFAIASLPLSTVASIEFLGTIVLAACGLRTARNAAALACTVAGVAVLTHPQFVMHAQGLLFAFANCALFALYVVLSHRLANAPADGTRKASAAVQRAERLGAAMAIAALVITPVGFPAAVPALRSPSLLAMGIVVGICSSVIPYVSDQMAMARLTRRTFALMLALLPAFATIIGAIVLRQMPRGSDVIGIVLVMSGISLHRQEVR